MYNLIYPLGGMVGNVNKWRNLHTNIFGTYITYGLDRYQSSRLSISVMGLVNIHDHLVSKLIFDTNCNMSFFKNTFAKMFKDTLFSRALRLHNFTPNTLFRIIHNSLYSICSCWDLVRLWLASNEWYTKKINKIPYICI